jgi:hypothetical protein
MQLTPESDVSELLDDVCKQLIQEIDGLLLHYARAVDIKLLVALSAIAARQAKAITSSPSTSQLHCYLSK